MKQSAYTKLLVAMIAFSCICCSCAKDPDSTSAKNSEATNAKISSSVDEDEPSENTNDESTSDTQTWYSTPSNDNVPDKDPSDISPDNLRTPATPNGDTAALGTGNLSNGAFATGDKQNAYYVTYAGNRVTIMKEDRASGTKTPIYMTVPKDEPIVDSLNIVGDTLYFRENQDGSERFMLVRLNVSDGTFDVLADGEIDSFSVYKENLYYAENCNLVKCDLDGQNKKVLFESEHSAVPAKIAYCITDNRIFFAAPGDYDKDGYFFGKLYSMDLDGQNKSEIACGADVCNSGLFMSDGEMLYFFGNSEKDGMGLYSCKLDGSGLTIGDKDEPRSMNFVAGKYIMATDAELYMKKDSTGWEMIDSGNIRFGKIVLVGDDIYYIDQNTKDPNSTPVMKRESMHGGPVETLG